MCIYYVRHPSHSKPIGKMHETLGEAKRAALRAAKRNGHARIDHWKNGPVLTVFSDGTEVKKDVARERALASECAGSPKRSEAIPVCGGRTVGDSIEIGGEV